MTSWLGSAAGKSSSRSPAGSLTDVAGLRVGHWTHLEAGTGCTVVLCEGGAVAGVDVRGAAPGTRETDLLRPGTLVERVHAVLLAGGSAFGLDAACGVMRYLEERGVGFPTAAGPVPIVPAAVLFDLTLGRADVRPDASAGYAACLSAGARVEEGTLGVGTGATVAKLAGVEGAWKGGVGTASRRLPGGHVIAALVAVNALGGVYDPATGEAVAVSRAPEGTPDGLSGANTTLGIIATTVPLDKASANRLATSAQDGLALAIRPAHTRFDGDTVFALSTAPDGGAPVHPVVLAQAATEVMAAAILRAVRLAEGLHGIPGLNDPGR